MSVLYCAPIAVWFIMKKDFQAVTEVLHIENMQSTNLHVDFGRKALVNGIRHGNLIHTSKIKI